MATKRVDFTVTTKGGVTAYILHVGLVPVLLTGGKGHLEVEIGTPQLLVWQFAGMPGDSLSITGQVGEQTVVQVTSSTIPPGSIHGAGFEKFTVK